LTLRAAGDTGRILSWLAVPGERYDAGVAADIDMTAYTAGQVHDIAAAARQLGQRARLQLKLDSGLGRGGAHPDHWPLVVDAAKQRQRAGDVSVTGIWSHLACSDEPSHPSNRAQLDQFIAGVEHAHDAGLDVEHLHLANSGAALAIPEAWFTMVRPGIAVYGVSPFADGTSPVELEPAMTLRAALALTKRVQAGHGVSYGHTYVTERETTLGLVPIGYGDGIPRHASGSGPALVGGHVFRIAGRVCMDQFVLDLGDVEVSAGDPVVLFGEGRRGEPTVHDWAAASDTIGYEIVTRIGSRVPRRYIGGDQ
jgi:alanine racemase